MNRSNFFKAILACTVVALTGWIAWYVISNLQNSDANVKAGIVGSLGVFVVAILTNAHTKRREISARHFAEKRVAYGKIIDLVFEIISSTKSGKMISETVLSDKMMKFKKELIIWGSSEVIQAWNNFELKSSATTTTATDPKQIIGTMEHVLRAIRKDLGHDDHRLKFGNLFGLVILAEDKHLIEDR